MGAANGCFRKTVEQAREEHKAKLTQEDTDSSEDYGITVTAEKNLSFYHAPLYKNEALFQKFSAESSDPDELSIPCMITDFHTNAQKGAIQVKVINEKPVELWVVCGGIDKVSITGLTLKMEEITWCGSMKIDNPSDADGKWHGAKPKRDWTKCKTITIILVQVSKENSLFIFNEFTMKGKRKRQKIEVNSKLIQWNSLSFNMRDVYKNTSNAAGNEMPEGNCYICTKEHAECIFLPCRHMCVCAGCVEDHKKNSDKCPVCEKKFKSVILYRDEDLEQESEFDFIKSVANIKKPKE